MRVDNLEDLYELSPMQKGMLFHTLTEPESAVYFNQVIWTLEGELDVPAFEQAWHRVIRRHSILRTAFFWEDFDEPHQVVFRRVPVPLDERDWRELTPAAQQKQLDAFLDRDRQQQFDLSRPPLMRITIIWLDDRRFHFVWSRHHILLDGWSQALVLREVFTLYELFRRDAYTRAEEVQLLGESTPYGEYIAWLQQQDRSDAEQFWRESLAGIEEPTPLYRGWDTTNAPRTEQEKRNKGVTIEPDVFAALRTMVQQHELTLYTLTQGMWALLLSRYSGDEDVLFGMTVAGRPVELPGIEKMVGLFINTLPVRIRVPDAGSLWNWLKRLQQQHIDLRRHEYSSLVAVHGWSDIPRTLPLFDSIVVFENFPMDTRDVDAYLSLNICDVHSVIQNNLPLTVRAIPAQDFRIELMYDRRRITTQRIDDMLEDIQLLFEHVASAPNTSVDALTRVFAEAERQRRTTKQQQFKSKSSKLLRRVRRRT